jgi:hypothetical protein
MRPSRGSITPVAIGGCLVAVLVACGGLVERRVADPAPTESMSPTESTSRDDSAIDETLAEGRIGGSATGFTLDLTDDWISVDLDTGELSETPEAVAFFDEVDIARQAVEQLGELPGAVYALEFGPQLHMMSEFVTNLNGYCIPNRLSPTMAQLARISTETLESMGAENVVSSETTAGSTPALRISYKIPMAGLGLRGLQYVFASDGTMCYLTFTTNDADDDLERFDQIAATLELT